MIEMFLPIFSSFVLASTNAPICPERSPVVNFKTKIEDTQYIKGKTSEEITQLYALGGGQVGQNSIVRGIATPQINISFDVTPKIIKTRSGHLCGYARNVDILLTASPIVHLASEYQFGSCEYKEVINHEKQHVEITKDLMRDYKRTVKTNLTNRVRDVSGHSAVPLQYKQELKDYIRQAAAIKIRQVEAELRTEHAKRQARIDTPEEYREIQNRCMSWER